MDLDALLEGLVRGDTHRGGIRCLRLFQVTQPFFTVLGEEVNDLRRQHPASHVGDTTHVTSWTGPTGTVRQHSLLNRSGRTDDFSCDHDLSSRGKWFFDGAAYPALDQLVADWPHLINVRVNALGPGAGLGAHEEHLAFPTAAGTVGARLRFHLPVATHADAELVLDGDVYHLEPATVYLVNQGCVHEAVNAGSTDRVHLVWDALLTEAMAEHLLGWASPPPHLVSCGPQPASPRRHQPVGSHRRMSPLVSQRQAATLGLCAPQ